MMTCTTVRRLLEDAEFVDLMLLLNKYKSGYEGIKRDSCDVSWRTFEYSKSHVIYTGRIERPFAYVAIGAKISTQASKAIDVTLRGKTPYKIFE